LEIQPATVYKFSAYLPARSLKCTIPYFGQINDVLEWIEEDL